MPTRQEIIEGLDRAQQNTWQFGAKHINVVELESMAVYVEGLIKAEVEAASKALTEVVDLVEQRLSPEVREAAKDLVRLRTMILDAVQWLDPECPDAEAYVDGHCDLVSSVRRLRQDSDTLKQLRDALDALSLTNRSSV